SSTPSSPPFSPPTSANRFFIYLQSLLPPSLPSLLISSSLFLPFSSSFFLFSCPTLSLALSYSLSAPSTSPPHLRLLLHSLHFSFLFLTPSRISSSHQSLSLH